MSAHKLKIETGRYGSKSENPANRLCDFCCDTDTMDLMVNLPEVDPIIEDETHFLRTCPRYHISRTNLQEPAKSLLMYDVKEMFRVYVCYFILFYFLFFRVLVCFNTA